MPDRSPANFAAAKAAGYSEDQLFKLVVCAAVGQSTRLQDAGLAALAEAVAGEEAGAAKLVFYRPCFYGNRTKEFTHEAMRGPSAWPVADRELMAAYVSAVNDSAFCVGAHTATASQAYRDGPKVAVLADVESAPVEEPLRATLRMLGKLTREGKLGGGDMRQVLSAGVSPQQVRDALAVCAAFNTTNRLADTFGFEVLSPDGFEAGTKVLLRRGYR